MVKKVTEKRDIIIINKKFKNTMKKFEKWSKKIKNATNKLV